MNNPLEKYQDRILNAIIYTSRQHAKIGKLIFQIENVIYSHSTLNKPIRKKSIQFKNNRLRKKRMKLTKKRLMKLNTTYKEIEKILNDEKIQLLACSFFPEDGGAVIYIGELAINSGLDINLLYEELEDNLQQVS